MSWETHWSGSGSQSSSSEITTDWIILNNEWVEDVIAELAGGSGQSTYQFSGSGSSQEDDGYYSSQETWSESKSESSGSSFTRDITKTPSPVRTVALNGLGSTCPSFGLR